jgi:hypothetical protein
VENSPGNPPAKRAGPDRPHIEEAPAACQDVLMPNVRPSRSPGRRRGWPDPARRLGIVAPDLASVRDRLEVRARRRAASGADPPRWRRSRRAASTSRSGRRLADLPLIRVALDLLALGSGRAKVEQSRLSALLLAGGWSAAEAEADGRARLDAALRRDLPYFTTLPALIRLAGRLAGDEPPLCPQTVAALDAFVTTLAA